MAGTMEEDGRSRILKNCLMPLPPYLSILNADLAQRPVDAIVNAANTYLGAGGGVCGAIFKAAGAEELQKACKAVGGCPTGGAKATPGFKVKAKLIIHAVGPMWKGGNAGEAALLASAYLRSLEVAADLKCQSIAFPAISCGIYGYPLKEAALIARRTIEEFQAGPKALKLVELVFIDQELLSITEQVWK